jgi:hypothetical protein
MPNAIESINILLFRVIINMAAVIGSAVISWALPGYRMVPGSSVYKAKGY